MNIYTLFGIILFSIGLCQAIVSERIIDIDVVEIMNLTKNLTSYSSINVQRYQSIICDMISVCCPSIRSNLSKYLNESDTNLENLMVACLKKYFKHSSFNSCPTFDKLNEINQNIDLYTIYYSSIIMASFDMNFSHVCSSDEIYAYLCKQNQQKMIKSCEHKKLKHILQEEGENNYHRFIQDRKKHLRSSIYMIKKIFIMENRHANTRATASSITMLKIQLIVFILLNLLYFNSNLFFLILI